MLKILLGASLVLYPIIVYFGLGHFDIRLIACGLLAALAIRSYLMPQQYRYRVWGMMAIGAFIFALILIFNDPLYLRLYPVMMSCFGLSIFVYSLCKPPSVIETFAKLYEFKDSEMPPHVVTYTRDVTKIWCVFFIVNGLIAIYSVFASLEFWTLYNGFISYILMGCLLGGEFIYRHLVVKKRDNKLDA